MKLDSKGTAKHAAVGQPWQGYPNGQTTLPELSEPAGDPSSHPLV